MLRYEDMLATPEQAFGRVAAFLGLRASAERLRRAIEHSSFEMLRRQEERRGFRERSLKSERFFREGRSGQWRERLSREQIDLLVAGCRAQMERFGYWPIDDAAND